MKRLLALILVLWPAVASAQNPHLSTAANDTLRRMFTQVGSFGPPPYAADPFTCTAQTKRTIYYNTASDTVFFCNGTAWTGLGGLSSPVAGDFVATGKWTWGTAADAVNSVRLGETAGCLVGEGATADAFETSLCFLDTGGADGGLFINFGASVTTLSSNGGVAVAVTDLIGNTRANSFLHAGGTANSFGGIIWDTAQTPDTFQITTGTTSNTIVVTEKQDNGTDLAIAAQTNPTLAVCSAASTSTDGECTFITHDQTNATFGSRATAGTDQAGRGSALYGGPGTGTGSPGDFVLQTGTALATGTTVQTLVARHHIEGGLRALTDATATTVFTVTTGNDLSCGGQLFFVVEAADAANQQSTSGSVNFAAADNAAGAGGEACAAAVTGTNAAAATSGTLTVTADATTGTDLCNIRLTATGSLTETVGPRVRYSVVFNPTSSLCAITPQ